MNKKSYPFSSGTVDYYFNAPFDYVKKLSDPQQTIYITDANVFQSNKSKFKGLKVIVINPGEANKVQATVDSVISQLIVFGGDRQSFLIGVGGGVVTDLTGYVASVYMRGIRFGFLPTTILAMVDASIGGKNGIDVGMYKNMVGTIRQPSFLLYDYSFLKTLPKEEWINGFAEIIKHASIKDAALFGQLEKSDLATYRKNPAALDRLIKRNVVIKSEIVKIDEFEKAERRLLNFGHTLGHAIETQNKISHGHAIAVGMVAASKISESLLRFSGTERLAGLLKKYGLPAAMEYDKKKVYTLLKMDKKKAKDSMNFVLLSKIGKAQVMPIPLTSLEAIINKL